MTQDTSRHTGALAVDGARAVPGPTSYLCKPGPALPGRSVRDGEESRTVSERPAYGIMRGRREVGWSQPSGRGVTPESGRPLRVCDAPRAGCAQCARLL